MTAHPRALALAEKMGRRAGELLRDHGIPTPCPIPEKSSSAAECAQAWRRAYAEASTPR